MGRTRSQQHAIATVLGDSVYAIKCGDFVKIGYGEPRGRLKGMRTGNPHPMEIVFTLSVTMARDVEREAHEILREHRTTGEWFAVTPWQAEAAIIEAARRADRRPKLSEKQIRYVLSQIEEFPPTA